MRNKSVDIIQQSYAWAISLLALLAVANAVANYAALEVQTGHIKFSMTAHHQSQLFAAVQTNTNSLLSSAKRESVDDTRFARVQAQLKKSVADLEAVNLQIGALLEGERAFWGKHVPKEVRQIYLEKPYELGRWMDEAASRAKAMTNLTRSELVRNDNNWTPLDIAMASGYAGKGFGKAVEAVEREATASAEKMEKFHLAMAALALLVLAAEAAFVFGPLVRRVRKEQIRAAEALAEIEALAFRDSVTGGANRARFHRALDEACARASEGASFAVILCDLDKFKSVNDGFGHQAGDRLLTEIAGRIRSAIRTEDLSARLGGDEFAILVDGVQSPAQLSGIVERIRARLAMPWECDGIRLDVSVSVGGALCPMHSCEPDRLLAYADRALYEAKQAEQHVSVFDRDQRERSDGDSALLRGLSGAFSREEFELHYQPKIRMSDGRVAGVEALVRWRHPELGLLMPATFLPVVNRGGKMVELTRMVVAHAGADLARWRRQGLDLGGVAVNLPESMLTSRLGLEALTEVIDRHSLSGDMFTIEITEDVFLSRAAAAIQTSVEAIARLGVRVAFDDFGTGFASLSHLRQFQFDELKIDRSFVADIGCSTMGEEIIHAIASLARALGKDLVAEGVETEEQLRFVKAQGCTFAQGYLFARPLPAKDLEDWVRRRSGEHRAHETVREIRPLRA